MIGPFTNFLVLDLETSSALDLTQVTADVYAQHPSTHVYTAVFGRVTNGHVAMELGRWRPGFELDIDVREFIEVGGPVVVWNAGFERAIWKHILTPRYGWPEIAPTQWRDAQAQALAMSLPATLEGTASVIPTMHTKDAGDKGRKLMLKMARAEREKGAWVRPYETADNVDLLEHYCARDVLATADVFRQLAILTPTEYRVWLVDQEINERGIYVDDVRAWRLEKLASQYGKQLRDQMREVTAGEVRGVSDLPGLKRWLDDDWDYLDKSQTLSRAWLEQTLATDSRLTQPFYQPVLDALKLRLEGSRLTSLAKLGRVSEAVDSTGRMRGLLRYHSAHTGRWSSTHLQVHNLPKDRRSLDDRIRANKAIDALDLDALAEVGPPLEALSLSLRSLISAPYGRELIAADYSAIEARVLPWLAGDDAKLQLFRDGVDTYVKAAADVGSKDRQLGKVCELALGYGMGAVKFALTANSWGVPLELKEARRIQKAWRKKNRVIVDFWVELEDAVRKAIRKPQRGYDVGPLRVKCGGGTLWIRLPSGRYLFYHAVGLQQQTKEVEVVDDAGNLKTTTFDVEAITYRTVGPSKKSMVPASLYGGLLAENVTQAVARDCLAHALLTLQKTDYDVVMHVHDSVVAEVDAGFGSVEEFEDLIVQMPPWAEGLPLAAEGYRGRRFQG